MKEFFLRARNGFDSLRGLINKHFYIISAIFPLYALIVVEINSYGLFERYAQGFGFARVLNLVFTLALIFVVYNAVALVSNSAGVAAIIGGLPGVVFAFANFQKILSVGNPLLISDLYLASKAGSISSFVGNFLIPPFFFISVGLLFVYIIALFIGQRRTNIKRSSGIQLITALFALPLISAFTVLRPFTTSSVASFYQRGYVATFIADMLNKKEAVVFTPESIDLASDVVSEEEQATIERKPDVIVMLSEAFWDPTSLGGVEFEPKPTQFFDSIRAQSVYFNMISPVFGGSTVVAEFEVLSGLTLQNLDFSSPYEQYISGDVPTLASYFKELGYDTAAIHSFDRDFYGRSTAYELFGFDKFIGEQDFVELGFDIKRIKEDNYITDETFMDVMISELDNAEEPKFIFGISMENHGLYKDKYPENTLTIKAPNLNKEQQNKVLNFAQGVYNADRQLERLISYLKERDRDTVLLYFGDHLPSMGPGYDVFNDSGYVENQDYAYTDAEWIKMHTVPAFVWSNYESKSYNEGLVSPFFTGNILLDYLDYPKNAFYSFLADYRKTIAVRNDRLTLTSNYSIIDGALSKEEKNMSSGHMYFSRNRIFSENVATGDKAD